MGPNASHFCLDKVIQEIGCGYTCIWLIRMEICVGIICARWEGGGRQRKADAEWTVGTGHARHAYHTAVQGSSLGLGFWLSSAVTKTFSPTHE